MNKKILILLTATIILLAGCGDTKDKNSGASEVTVAKAQSQTVTEKVTEPVIETVIETAPTSSEKSETEVVTKAETAAVTKAQTKAQTQAETQVETAAQTQAETSPPQTQAETQAETVPPQPVQSNSDSIIKELWQSGQSDVQVEGKGVVTKILADDNDGSRHQRFILKLNSGQTLLIAHNIDIAPRIDSLAVGNTVEFYGEYYYNEQGGGIHWTHSDPDGSHVAGYLKCNGNVYQ